MRLTKPLKLAVIVLGVTVLLSGCSNKQQDVQLDNVKPSVNHVELIENDTIDVIKDNDIVKAGFVEKQGNLIYYIDYEYIGAGKLYIIKPDGTENRHAYYGTLWDMKLIDDWLYFLSDYENGCRICKVKTDGYGSSLTLLVDTDFAKDKNGTIILNNNVISFDIVNDMIYYTIQSDNESKCELYRIRTDGTGKIKIADDVVNVTIKDGWIFYTNLKDEIKLYKMKLDGSEKTKVSDDQPGSFIIAGDWIYFAAPGPILNKIKIDGTNRQQIYIGDSDLVLNADNDWVYFSISGNGIYKVKNTSNPEGTKPIFIKPF